MGQMLKDKIARFFADKYTFIFVPDITGKFIRFSTPKALIKGAAVAGLAFLFAFSWFSWSVLQKNSDLHELRDLQRLTAEQKLEIQRFSKKVKRVETQLARLEKFDRKLRVITALDPQKNVERDYGSGGPNKDMDMTLTGGAQKKYSQSLLDSLNSDLDRINHQAELQEASFFELDEFFRDQSSLLSHSPSIWPVKGWVTSTFGYRRSPFTGLREMHEGIDIATHLKAPIIAPADGIVVRSEFRRGYGNVVEIDHGYGVVTRFGHASKNLVKRRQKVKRGDVVALVGSTGRSTGPHLHYEVLLNGVPVNPYRYILGE